MQGATRLAGAGPAGGAAAVAVALLALAALGWWWSAEMVDDMQGHAMPAMGSMAMEDTMSFASFALAWAAMMAAMMLPGVLPVVALYRRAAAAGRVAPTAFFVSGYLAVWIVTAVPGYLAWRALDEPLAEGAAWAGRLAGGALLAAAAWQLTPLKTVCLRHCRSPLGFFLRWGGRAARPAGALRLGASHGAFCLGCCWALFAVLVAVGTMELAWMAALAALILVEKHARHGEQLGRAGAVVLAALGVLLLADPSTLAQLT